MGSYSSSAGGGGGGLNAAQVTNIVTSRVGAAVAAALANVKQARFTLAESRASWGGLSTGSNAAGRVVAAPSPQTIGLTADGSLPSGITLANDVITFRDAGRVRMQVNMHIEAHNTDGNAQTGGNNSRSDVECFIEHAPSGGTFAVIEESRSTTSYMRVAKPYWNHGPGEARLRTAVDMMVAAGARFRIRAEAEFNQAATVQHSVIGGVASVMQ